MLVKDLLSEIDSTTADLLQTISSFSQEQFNTVPFAGSWTAAQVSEHLFKSESGVPEVLWGATQPTERAPNEKVPVIESIFLDFTTKLQSPAFILPSDEVQEKEMLLNALKNTRTEIRTAASSLDLSETCISSLFPVLGPFTRLEWTWFVVCHSRRHIRQLKNIYAKLSNHPIDAM